MKFYMAPMEGVTGYAYRNVYHSFYDNIDKFYTPFIAPSKKTIMRTRERKDVAPEHNQGMKVVPQILTKDADDFLNICNVLLELGYDEINLNLGCPASTVVTKGKGAGFLAEPNRLDAFFDQVFCEFDKRGINQSLHISVKTRLGMEEDDEFWSLLEIYNQYPFSELILHPRVQKDLYRNTPRRDVYGMAMQESKCPVCYNGDIFSKKDYEEFVKQFPQTTSVMLGRGIIANPGLVNEILKGENMSKEQLKEYHHRLLVSYLDAMDAPRDALFKMKEHWAYLGFMFENADKYLKKIRKANKMEEYEASVEQLFATCERREKGSFKLN